VDSSELKEQLDRGPDPPYEGTILSGKRSGAGHAQTCPVVDILKATQQEAEPVRRGCLLVCTRCGANWRSLANTIELSMSGADETLCQITLTTY